MPRQGWELLLRAALEDAGFAHLPAPTRHRIAVTIGGRLRRYGLQRDLHNWGGVLCLRHVHTDCCNVVNGRRFQRFPSDIAGMRRLVELCMHYTGAATVEGFRSVLRTGSFFGPSDDAEKAYQELTAAWAGLESEFGAAKLRSGFTKESYETWLAFRDKWQSGDADTTALPAMVADVNVTRQNLGKARVDIQPPPAAEATSALKLAANIDKGARVATSVAMDAVRDAASTTAHAWSAIPMPAKLGAGLVAVLGTVLTVFRVTR